MMEGIVEWTLSGFPEKEKRSVRRRQFSSPWKLLPHELRKYSQKNELYSEEDLSLLYRFGGFPDRTVVRCVGPVFDTRSLGTLRKHDSPFEVVVGVLGWWALVACQFGDVNRGGTLVIVEVFNVF